MNREDVLEGTKRRAGLESDTDAERAAIATLTTLGEHVSAGEADDLSEPLPGVFAEAVQSRTDEDPESFGVDEFAGRVASREGDDVDPDDAVVHVRAVTATLSENGLHNELQEAREQLPNEFATFFETDELHGV